MTRAYYLLIGFVSGAAVLALEVLAARAIAPAIGAGSVTWSALLAVALGMLSAGNLLGGLLSERIRPGGAIAWSLVVASAYLVALSQFYPDAMRWSAGTSLILGSVAAALTTQAVPMGMLGVLTPVILRQGRHRGRWGGFVLAAGSGGGIAGALLAGLLLLPGLGIERSYLLIAIVAAMAAVPILPRERRWLAGVTVAVVLAVALACWMRHEDLAVVQSQYGQLEVTDDETGRVLLIDGLPQTGFSGGELLPGDGLFRGYLLEAALTMGPPPRNALVVGLGGGLAPRLLAAHGIECRTVEIDPAVVKIAREQFDFDGLATVADGRSFLSRTDERYDLIFLDVCTSDRLAWHLFTREAMQTVRRRLSSDGLLVIQFIGDDGPWSASLSRTVELVFGDSLMLTSPGQFSGVGPRWLFASPDHRPRVPEFMFGVEQPRPWEIIELEVEGELLTDDHFPAEMAWARTAMRWRGAYGGE